MKGCRFILVRHGESEGNFKRIFLGHTDLELTDLGHRQAEATAELLKDVHIDTIYSSDLKRAWQTAEHIAERHDLSVIADSQFREVYAGNWEGMSYSDIMSQYPEEFDLWVKWLGKAYCVGGETTHDVLDRVYAELLRLAQLNEGKTICIATHATPVRVLRTVALGLDFETAKIVGPANASVTVIDVIDGKLKLLADGYDEHLKNIRTMPNI